MKRSQSKVAATKNAEDEEINYHEEISARNANFVDLVADQINQSLRSQPGFDLSTLTVDAVKNLLLVALNDLTNNPLRESLKRNPVVHAERILNSIRSSASKKRKAINDADDDEEDQQSTTEDAAFDLLTSNGVDIAISKLSFAAAKDDQKFLATFLSATGKSISALVQSMLIDRKQIPDNRKAEMVMIAQRMTLVFSASTKDDQSDLSFQAESFYQFSIPLATSFSISNPPSSTELLLNFHSTIIQFITLYRIRCSSASTENFGSNLMSLLQLLIIVSSCLPFDPSVVARDYSIVSRSISSLTLVDSIPFSLIEVLHSVLSIESSAVLQAGSQGLVSLLFDSMLELSKSHPPTTPELYIKFMIVAKSLCLLHDSWGSKHASSKISLVVCAMPFPADFAMETLTSSSEVWKMDVPNLITKLQHVAGKSSFFTDKKRNTKDGDDDEAQQFLEMKKQLQGLLSEESEEDEEDEEKEQ